MQRRKNRGEMIFSRTNGVGRGIVHYAKKLHSVCHGDWFAGFPDRGLVWRREVNCRTEPTRRAYFSASAWCPSKAAVWLTIQA